ncbi:MAG TPA: hypothetical protein VI911_04935 [Patescibacteria group bacterium]|nr:hypothetical protein [Patescibacteria group bacterium]
MNKIQTRIKELKREMQEIEYEESKKSGVTNWIANGGSENNNIQFGLLSAELKGITETLALVEEEINRLKFISPNELIREYFNELIEKKNFFYSDLTMFIRDKYLQELKSRLEIGE